MKKQWSIVLLIALILVVVIFSVLNVDPVAINFGFDTFAVPLVIVIIATLLIGVLIAAVFSTSILLRNKSEQKKLNRQIADLTNQSAIEKDEIRERFDKEIADLRKEKEKDEATIRKLERRIQNMETSRSAYENNSLG